MHLTQASTVQEIAAARALFEEFAAWLTIDLCFQGFAAELAGLPGLYAPPRGRLLLATANGDVAGCVALRPLSDSVCEMKRLYVKPAFRGQGVGKMLAERTIAEAKIIGYQSMQLDTLPTMKSAVRLYESLGFVRCAAYYNTPFSETVFMELQF